MPKKLKIGHDGMHAWMINHFLTVNCRFLVELPFLLEKVSETECEDTSEEVVNIPNDV